MPARSSRQLPASLAVFGHFRPARVHPPRLPLEVGDLVVNWAASSNCRVARGRHHLCGEVFD